MGWQLLGAVAASRATHGGVGAGMLWGGRRRARVSLSGLAVATEGGFGARAELNAQFHILPGSQPRWSLYGNGGLGYLSAEGRRGKAFLMLGLGLERNPGSPRSQFIEVGLGEGVRVGIGIRFRAQLRRRGS